MKNPQDFLCPRCGGLIPSADFWGEYPGALSRHTRGADDEPLAVCSACGAEEAFEEFTGDVTHTDAFPILTDAAILRRFEAIAVIENHLAGVPQVPVKRNDPSRFWRKR